MQRASAIKVGKRVRVMKCSKCHRPCKPLFTTLVCDWCDGHLNTAVDRGFIVYLPDKIGSGNLNFIFRNRTDAAIWRSVKGLQAHAIREVLAPCTIRWMKSKGSMEEVELADRAFEIFADHRFPFAENRAYLAPLSRSSSRGRTSPDDMQAPMI